MRWLTMQGTNRAAVGQELAAQLLGRGVDTDELSRLFARLDTNADGLVTEHVLKRVLSVVADLAERVPRRV